MQSFRLNNIALSIDKDGAGNYTKASYPIRAGRYSEIKSAEFEFQFNPKGEIKFIRGLGPNWRHPSELLKRTDSNDWVYYSVGSIGEKIYSWLGEYYLPCLPYYSNAIWEFNPFTDSTVMGALGAWAQMYANLHQMERGGLPPEVIAFLDSVKLNDETALHQKAEQLHSIIGGLISVLPPDTRHVDYEVIPLNIADGCLYHCNFCCVKSAQTFRPRSRDDVEEQIRQLKSFYGPSLGSYKALFLGNHDALGVGDDLISMAASRALKEFELENPIIYMFGSVDSLLKAGGSLLAELDQLSHHTYINIGLESVDEPTLKSIGKPLDAAKVREAFDRMLDINQNYDNVEVTANFLLGDKLSPSHNESLMELLEHTPDAKPPKGAVYLSPLIESQKKPELLDAFYEIKKLSKLPAYIYLIQRL